MSENIWLDVCDLKVEKAFFERTQKQGYRENKVFYPQIKVFHMIKDIIKKVRRQGIKRFFSTYIKHN